MPAYTGGTLIQYQVVTVVIYVVTDTIPDGSILKRVRNLFTKINIVPLQSEIDRAADYGNIRASRSVNSHSLIRRLEKHIEFPRTADRSCRIYYPSKIAIF